MAQGIIVSLVLENRKRSTRAVTKSIAKPFSLSHTRARKNFLLPAKIFRRFINENFLNCRTLKKFMRPTEILATAVLIKLKLIT